MALSDRDIIIVPSRGTSVEPVTTYRGADASSSATITLRVVNSGTSASLSFEGSAGQLFSINDQAGGTVFSANDVSGIPSIEVLDSGQVKLAEYNGFVTVGGAANQETASSTSTGELRVIGGMSVWKDLYVAGVITANQFSGTTSVANQINITNDSSSASTQYLAFVSGTSGAQTIRIDTSLQYVPSTNRLGIGRAPDYSLDVAAQSSPFQTVARFGNGGSDILITHANAIISHNASYNGGWTRTGSGPAGMIDFQGGRFDFQTSPTSGAGGSSITDLTSRMVILNNGNVGIGDTSPSQKLVVSGAAVVTGGIYGAETGAPDSTIWAISGDYTNWGLFYNEGDPDFIEFKTGGTVSSRIALDTGAAHFGLNGGSVGVGTSSPSGRLHVQSAGMTAAAPSLGWPVYNAEADASSRAIYIDTAGNGSVATAGQGATVSVILGQYYDSRVVITPSGNGGASPGDQGTGRGKDMLVKAGTSDNGVGFSGGRLYLSGGMGYTAAGYNGNVGNLILQPFGGSVGIGTATPSSKLHIYESTPNNVVFTMTPANGSYDAIINMTGQDGNINTEGFQVQYRNAVGDVILKQMWTGITGATPAIRFSTGNTADAAVITGNGNFGLATTAPARTLDVNGVANFRDHIAQTIDHSRPNVAWGAGGTSTGAVIIKFPGGTGNYGMIHCVIDIYTYDGEGASTVIVGGHNWNSQWYAISGAKLGNYSKGVRVGVKDGQYCIVLGTNTSSWSYGQVRVRKIQNGSYYSGVMDLSGTYTITQDSAAESYTWISSNLISTGGSTGWNSSNDGSGSGLDADLLDGIDSTGFVRSNASTSGYIQLEGGGQNSPTDATLYVTATNNNDWLLRLNAQNSSKTEYGAYIQIPSSAAYAWAVYTDSGSWNWRINGAGHSFSPIYYDVNDTARYMNMDGNNTSQIGTLRMNGDWGGGVHLEQLTVRGTYASLCLRATNGNQPYWLMHNDSNAALLFYGARGAVDGTSWDWAFRMYGNSDGLYAEGRNSLRAPIFYDSNDTGYYADPNSTSNFVRLNVRRIAANPDGNTNDGTTGTISLWTNPESTTSTLMFKRTDQTYGTHGAVTDTYASYWVMDTNNRGWIFRNASTSQNIFSISNVNGVTTLGTNFGSSVLAQLNVSQGYGAQTWRDIDIKGNWNAGEGHAISATHSTGASNLVGQMVFQHDSPGSRIKWGRLYHSGDVGTYPMQLISNDSSGNARLEMSSGSDIRAPIFYDSNDTNYYVDPASTTRLNVLTVNNFNITNGQVSGSQTAPVGHYGEGHEIFSIDPTWTNTQIRAYFNNNNVTWVADSTAPGGYAIQVSGGVSVGGDYGSGFPYIPVDQDDVFYMECWIKDVVGTNYHYMGSIDYNHNFSSLGGNPGSFGYWVMSYTGSAGWNRYSGYITGFGSSTGQFKTGTKYWTPQALFNYGGGGTSYISGWKVIKINRNGPLIVNLPSNAPVLGVASALQQTLTVKKHNQGQINFGAYPGSWSPAIQLQNNDNTRLVWIGSLDSSYRPRIRTGGAGLDIYTNGSVTDSGTYSAMFESGSVRSTIFYDLDDTNYYLNPNSTSVLFRPNNATQQRWSAPWRAMDDGNYRPNQTSDTNYWTTTQGWGTNYGGWDAAWKYGATGLDIWGSSSGHPQGSGYVHAQGINAGMHYSTSDGSSAYGWQMVGAGDADSRWWLRGKWGSTTRPWYEIALYDRNVGGNLYANVYYDSNDTYYYVDPHSVSRTNRMGSFYLQNNYDVSADHQFGVYYAEGLSTAYAVYREGGSWTYPYPDLRLAFHTGLKFGANPSYEGMRFYTDYDMSSRVMQVNGSSNYIYMDRWINVLAGQGIYSGENGAHFYPNNGDYGSWRIDGTRNGWYGIYFASGSTLMMNDTEGGIHRSGNGWRIYHSGNNLYARGEITAYWSDRRLKQNIKPLERGSGLELVDRLTPSSFEWNQLATEVNEEFSEGQAETALIAQEVQEVLPIAVAENKAGRKVGKDSNLESYLTVKYDKITPFLIQAVKDLLAEVNDLKAEVKDLKDKLNNGSN